MKTRAMHPRRPDGLTLTALTVLPLLAGCPPTLHWAGVFGADFGPTDISMTLTQDGSAVVVENFTGTFSSGTSLPGWAVLVIENCPGIANDADGDFVASDCAALLTQSWLPPQEFVVTITGVATQTQNDTVMALDVYFSGAPEVLPEGEPIPLPRVP